jgi:hypothetical protein
VEEEGAGRSAYGGGSVVQQGRVRVPIYSSPVESPTLPSETTQFSASITPFEEKSRGPRTPPPQMHT